MLPLFDHNEKAYNAAIAMLSETGKAAVIHPTGTGKSYIAFKLCVEHPDSMVCWLSPSRYIFDVQIQNLQSSSGVTPENIRFFTYAKLAQMDQEERSKIKPDYLILDEFHRCGAEIWGQGVQTLLTLYPDVPVLGLSATNIRYLDNQRDMADELFDGNIASQMTLGEAIVRGILKPPTYVTALYRYQQNFEQIQHRVCSVRDKIVRDEGEKYLELLKRTLQMSQGLEKIFPKYMTEKAGKYIVFCASKKHMDEMRSHIREWFGAIDSDPNVYCAYSSDPETSKAFADFVNDHSEHLKLLFCIDMLNEGVHVEDVSGVILFRPTVSPIVYKQQIGRAMSAGSKNGALILDIVDNISGLYSIGAIQEEMQQAIEVYEMDGENEKIVNETFRIIDEVRDCRQLFDSLEGTLSASWDLMYGQAEKYVQENGNLDVPAFYVSPEDYPLGRWITTQRNIYRGVRVGTISKDQIEKLNAIGMDWRSPHEKLWDQWYQRAEEYFEKNQRLSISGEDRADPELERLANWLQRQRVSYKNQELTAEQIQRLERIQMVWGKTDFWQIGFEHAQAFYFQYGHLDIPAGFNSEDGYHLGTWYRGVRDRYRSGELSEDEKGQLESIGIQWESMASRSWKSYYQAAFDYYKEHGNLTVNIKYVTDDGIALGAWLSSQRYAHQKGKMPKDQQVLLDAIGMSWGLSSDKWNYGYSLAESYFQEHGDLNVPSEYLTAEGFKLGKWIGSQRTRYRQEKLIPLRVRKLNRIGMIWDTESYVWNENFQLAKQYYKTERNLLIPNSYITPEGIHLGQWVANQRTQYRKENMSPERIHALEEIGMVWDVEAYQWEIGYSHLLAYKGEFGSISVPLKYSSLDGFQLGTWVSTQKRAFRNEKLKRERIEKLQKLGFDFPDRVA